MNLVMTSMSTTHKPSPIACTLICLACCLTTQAGNWPRFRGPNGQGISNEADFPAKWSDRDMAWNIQLNGTGHSSPVVWDDLVFVTTALPDTAQVALLAIQVSDGKTLWSKQHTLRPLKMNRLNSYAASTPAVDADHVYAVWYGAGQTLVTALDHSGRELWTRDFGRTALTHGASASPIVYQGRMIFAHEQPENDQGLQGYWYALDCKTGQIRWRVKRANSAKVSYSTPCIYRSHTGQDQLIFNGNAYGLCAVEPLTGHLLWDKKSILPARVVGSPVLAGGLIVSTCGSGGSGKQMTVIRPAGAESAEAQTAYTLTGRVVPYVPTPLARGKWLFAVHDGGQISCLESVTGKTLWREKPGGRFYSSPVCASDKLYCVDMTGKVIVLDASDQYELLAVNDLREPSYATPAIAHGRLFVRTLSQLICIKSLPGS
jgi:outer membrane protein assembly factor BamB